LIIFFLIFFYNLLSLLVSSLKALL
jgi:hypothetical protein